MINEEQVNLFIEEMDISLPIEINFSQARRTAKSQGWDEVALEWSYSRILREYEKANSSQGIK